MNLQQMTSHILCQSSQAVGAVLTATDLGLCCPESHQLCCLPASEETPSCAVSWPGALVVTDQECLLALGSPLMSSSLLAASAGTQVICGHETSAQFVAILSPLVLATTLYCCVCSAKYALHNMHRYGTVRMVSRPGLQHNQLTH